MNVQKISRIIITVFIFRISKILNNPVFNIVTIPLAIIYNPIHIIFIDIIFLKYGLCPETCLMIGNDAAADIQGAASAGMESRYIHTGISPARPASLPNSCREIYSLQELL